MKFKDYKYERPNVEEIINKINEITLNIKDSKNKDEYLSLVKELDKISDDLETMSTICSIRNSINTADEFYEHEQEFFDENMPLVENALTKCTKEMLNSKFKKELEDEYGIQYINKLELSLKAFDEKIIDDLIKESKLVTKYSKVLASAKIEFDGKINNLSQMGVYANNPDRNIRKEASIKVAQFMSSVEDEIEKIYDDLVHVRTNMAKKMGYDNYIPFGYIRLGRSDYNSLDVKKYREQVYKYVVPLAKKLIDGQKDRIGIKDFKSYDISIFYKDGNPMPKGDKNFLLNSALQMYSSLSNETKEFFNYMLSNELLDLETKPNKQGGGYCTMIANYKSPFIFSNFNGTMADIDVLTHEAGHAFEVYTASRLLKSSNLYWPTLEACEIHSMSMEFFAYPYMDLFVNDAAKYRFKHLSEAITFIPYGVCVDDFQHFVYENPDISIKERNLYWKKIEKMYTPWKDYDGIEYYENGAFWLKQSHIFTSAFYYIDYTLAQVCAFQYYLKDLENHQDAWDNYYNLCKLGGSKSFTKLLETQGLKNPFEDGSLEEIMKKIEAQVLKIAIK